LLSFICGYANGDFVPGEEAVEPGKGNHKDDLAIGIVLKKDAQTTSLLLFYPLCGTPQRLQPALSQVSANAL